VTDIFATAGIDRSDLTHLDGQPWPAVHPALSERVARITYFGTNIEYELEQAGVALLAADEGIDPATIPALGRGSGPVKRATPTLTRRVKQAIAE